MPDAVEYKNVNQIAIVTVKNPPVNALSADVRDGLMDSIRMGIDDQNVNAILILGDGRTFIAGADIREFGKGFSSGTPIHDVINLIENSPKLVIAAIHGTALGGGLEVTLACHYRYAVADSLVGLPEVKLGLLPGAGGTQRLPRLIGAKNALDIIVSGDFVAANEAKDLGIVDEVGEKLVEGAIEYTKKLVKENAVLRKIRDLDCKADGEVFTNYRKSIAQRSRGFLAPWKCIDCVEAAATLPFDKGMEKEHELFKVCLDSSESLSQRHVFFSEREVAKIPDIPKTTPAKRITKVAMIGAGTMGGGISMNFLNAGIPVTILEMGQKYLDRGVAIIRNNYENTMRKGRLTRDQVDERMGLLSPTTDYSEIEDADLVIEAVFEEMDIKKQVFSKLDQVVRKDSILASNTSTLDIDQIANVTTRPDKVIGMHFFSPANVMRLLEVVRGSESSAETIATAMEIGRKIGKISVLAGNCHGFIGNRMLHGYSGEGSFLLEEGALPHQVDKVIFNFGLPMGPFQMGDLAGLDIGWRIRKARISETPSNQPYSGTISDRICEKGRYGQKTLGGYYDYKEGERTGLRNSEVENLIAQVSAEKGIVRREIPDDEILKRCMYPLVNIGTQILDENIAIRSSDIDIIYINGYGFPAYRGGPMFWADQIGLSTVYNEIKEYHMNLGERWRPSPLLKQLVEEGKNFADYDREKFR